MSLTIDPPLPQQPTNADAEHERRQHHGGDARRGRVRRVIGPRCPRGAVDAELDAAQRLADLGDLVEELGRLAGVARCGRGRAATSMTSVIRPGPRRHHDDAVGEVHRLGDRVGDEHDRGARLARRCAAARPACARGSSRRARRTARPSAAASGCAASARAMATRCCMPPDSCHGMCVGEVGQLDQLEHLRGCGRGAWPCPSPSARAAARCCARRCATRTGRSAGTPCRSPGRAGPGAPTCR